MPTFFSYLIVIIFGMCCHYYSQTDVRVEPILGVNVVMGTFPVCFCIMNLMTAEHQEAGVGCLLDELNSLSPLLPVGETELMRSYLCFVQI